MLVVRNQAAFEARYGTSFSASIAGEFGPSRLDNAGERIHLVNAFGSTIQDFTYGDAFPWPGESGFPGYSLVLVQGMGATPDHGDPGNWRSSGFIDGSPVGSDQTGLVGDPMADLDQDGIANIIEHALGTSDTDGGEGGSVMEVGVQNFSVNDITNNFLVISFRRKITADDVSVVPQIGSDLTNWSGDQSAIVFVSEVNSNDGLSLVTYRSAQPFDPELNEGFFFRLAVSER